MPDEAMPNEESAQLPIRVAGESLHVRRVFGEPYEFDGAVLVPVAKVMGGTGMGYGSGTLGPDEHKSTTQHGEGDGGGGGFGVRTKPVGAYRIKDGDVTWLPAFDLTRVALGAQAVIAVALVALAWARRRRKR